MRVIVVRRLLIDVLHMHSKAATLLDIPFATDLYDGRSHPRVSAANQAPHGGDEVRHRCTRPEGDQSRSGAAQGGQASPPLFDALVSGRIGSVAELASLGGISDRYEALASVAI